MSADFHAELEELAAAGRRRELVALEPIGSGRALLGEREVVVLCSNDYLGLAADPRLKAVACDAIARSGVGAGASRLISGSMTIHRRLEEALA